MDGLHGSPMICVRKLFLIICVGAILLAALSPVSAGLLWAILVPLLFVVGIATMVWTEPPYEERGIPTCSSLSVIAARAPPPADLLI
jgi:hypothetical protein